MQKLLSLLLILAFGAARADVVTVETYRGPVEVARNPQTLVVFDVAAADTLAALGVRPAGLVAPLYVDYLGDLAARARVVGTLFEPDFEALAAMRPDLIIAGGRSQTQVPDLGRMAPTLDMTIWDDTVPQALARLAAYGAIFGKEPEAARLAADLTAARNAARAAMAGKGRALMVMTNGPKLSAFGRAGRFGWLFSELDLEDAAPEISGSAHGEAISFEFIRQVDPEILIVLDRLAATGQSGQTARATLDNALVRDTAAWRSGQVHYLDGARLYVATGGVQALIHTFDSFTHAFGGR